MEALGVPVINDDVGEDEEPGGGVGWLVGGRARPRPAVE